MQNSLERFRQKNQCKKHDETVTELSREALLTSLTICSVKFLQTFHREEITTNGIFPPTVIMSEHFSRLLHDLHPRLIQLHQ